jgi:hypothetical protein
MQQHSVALVSGEIDVAQVFEPYTALLGAHHDCAVWATAAARRDTTAERAPRNVRGRSQFG